MRSVFLFQFFVWGLLISFAGETLAEEIKNAYNNGPFPHVHKLNRKKKILGEEPQYKKWNVFAKITEVHLLAPAGGAESDSKYEVSVRLRAKGSFSKKYSNCFEWKSGKCLGYPYMNKIGINQKQNPGSKPQLFLASFGDKDSFELDVTAWENDDQDGKCGYEKEKYNNCISYDSGDDSIGTKFLGSIKVINVSTKGKTYTAKLGNSLQVKLKLWRKSSSKPALQCQYGICFRFPTKRSKVYKPFYQDNKSFNGPYYVDHDGDWENGDTTCKNYLGLGFADHCYGNHRGTDFILKGYEDWPFTSNEDKRVFKERVPVYAAARGRVVAIRDGLYDKCHASAVSSPTGNSKTVSCDRVPSNDPNSNIAGKVRPEEANYITIETTNGDNTSVRHTYYHLRTNSILVTENDWVECGEKIADVGSSGISSLPHLHFGIHAFNSNMVSDGYYKVIDPFYYESGRHNNEKADGWPTRNKSMWSWATHPDQHPTETCQQPYNPKTGNYYSQGTGF